MQKNIGDIDRAIRFALGIAIIGIGLFFQSWWGALGVILLVTVVVGWCPPYALFGINTIRKESKEKKTTPHNPKPAH